MPILLAVLTGSFLFFGLYVASRPSAFRIARSRVIPASPAALYPLIVDLHAWSRWSPWEKLDPSMTKNFDGPDTGVGASYHWVGNKKVGEGKMTITDCAADQRVVIDLEFLQPFPARNVTTFTLEPEAEGTRVTWAMEGNRNFVMKLFNVFMNMDNLVGRDFENGLTAMAEVARGSSTADA